MTGQTFFEVKGRGTFPFDMLRYDSCWPYAQTDVEAIANAMHDIGERKVRLVTNGRVTPDRWASFGWEMIPQGRTE